MFACATQEDTPQRPTRDSPDDGVVPRQAHMQVASMKQAPMGMYIQRIADKFSERTTVHLIVEESYFDDFHMLKKRPPKQLEVPGNAFSHVSTSKRVLYTKFYLQRKSRTLMRKICDTAYVIQYCVSGSEKLCLM